MCVFASLCHFKFEQRLYMAYTRAVIKWNKNTLLRSCLEDLDLKIDGSVASPSMELHDVVRGDVS